MEELIFGLADNHLFFNDLEVCNSLQFSRGVSEYKSLFTENTKQRKHEYKRGENNDQVHHSS